VGRTPSSAPDPPVRLSGPAESALPQGCSLFEEAANDLDIAFPTIKSQRRKRSLQLADREEG
jgi:hypothetical protein